MCGLGLPLLLLSEWDQYQVSLDQYCIRGEYFEGVVHFEGVGCSFSCVGVGFKVALFVLVLLLLLL